MTAIPGAKVINSTVPTSFVLCTTALHILGGCKSCMRQQCPAHKKVFPSVNYKVIHKCMGGQREKSFAGDHTAQDIRSTTRTQGVLVKV